MSNINDIISFQGTGLDTDSDLLALPRGSSRYRLNVIGSEDTNHDVLTNIKGNTLKTHTLPDTSGELTVVGSVEDKENNALIYFIHNSSGYPAIVRYNYGSDDFTDIINPTDGGDYYTNTSALMASGALADGYFIDSRIIGNEDEQTLIWVDGLNSPKSINISKAIANGYNTVLVEDEIALYKRPYIENISVVYGYDSGYEGNDLKGKYFQFSVRLKYFDKTFTTISPFSEIALPDSENMPNGRLTEEKDNNFISVGVTLLHELSVVDSWQLLYRVIDIGDGTPGSWNIYANYDYFSKGTMYKSFYNDSSIGIVSDDEANRPYDFVPDISTHVGVIDSNRAVFDVTQEGFDNVDYGNSAEWDVSLIPTETAISTSDNGINYAENNTIGESGSGFNTTETFSTITDLATDDFFYIVQASETDASIPTFDNTFYYIESSYKTTDSSTIDDIITFINGTGYPVTADKNGSDLRITITPSTPTNILVTIEVIIIERTKTFRSLKTQSKYKFGIRYGYGGKVGTVQFNDDLVGETEPFKDLTSTDTLYTVDLRMAIDHAPPAGATDFQVVSFGNNIDYFEEYIVAYSRADITDDAAEFTMYSDGSNTVIRRDDMVSRFKSAYNSGSETIGSDIVNYGIDYGFDIQEGDIVRFVGRSKSVSAIGDYDFTLFTTDLDFRIDSVSSTEIKIGYSALSVIDDIIGTSSDTEILLIQIIKLKDTLNSIAQEFSRVYSITGGYHTGNSQNQTASLPALIDIADDFCDTWKTKQVFMNQHNSDDYGFTVATRFSFGWMEKVRASLYYDSYPTSQGRFNAVNEFSEARSDNKIRFTGKFLDEAGVNFLSRVQFDDERFLDDRNGVITRIEQIGDTLKVYQKRKVSGFRLKAITSTDIDGDNISAYSDDVLSPSPYQTDLDFGCTNFESYVKNIRSGYFFDVKNGSVVRDSPAGLEPISDYGMHTFFKDISQQILALGEDKIRTLGAYDDDNDMYLISFIYKEDLNNTVNQSLAFHEATNKWVSHYSLPTSSDLNYYGRLSGKTFTSFLNGNLYLHNDNSTRCNLWGQQYGSQVRIHSNENPNLIKIWDNVEIVSTGQWAPSSDGDVEVNLPTSQQSRLKSGRFELQESEYRSDFMKDMLSGDSSPQENNLFNGEALRGYDIHVNLRNADTTKANLRLVKINGTVST